MLSLTIFVLVNAFNLNSVLAVSPESFDSAIKYPEEYPNDIPDQCKDLTYCTIKPANYPAEKFKNMFKGYKALPQPTLVQEISFDNRIANPEDIDNCEVDVTNEPLYKIRETRDTAWRTVVQVPDINFVQRIRLEKCVNPNKKCFNAIADGVEYETFCKQKYVVWEVLVSKGNNETEKITPKLPVCCSCHYKPISFAATLGRK